MITGFIIQIFNSFVSFMLGLLPSSTGLPTGAHDAIETVLGYIQPMSFLVNFDVLFQVLIATIAFEIVVLTAKMSFWLIKVVRGHG